MSEIEKMYKNAGIKQLPTCNNCNMLVEYWSNGTYCSTCRDDKDNNECGMADYTYPPFTAEKQILLLQLLARIESADYFQFFFYEIKQEWVFRLNMLTELSCESAYIYESRNENFDECIAGLLNLIWQDLSPEEKQQVKGNFGMREKFYECIIYTFIRGLIHHYGSSYNLIQVKRELDEYHACWLYKILKIFI